MAGTASDLTGGFNSAGLAVQDIFNARGSRIMAQGYRDSAASYSAAAKFAKENADITRESTKLQTESADRAIYKTIGGQAADVAGAGFASSGSALDILADSEAQGKLTLDLIAKQGEINVNGYEMQAKMYRGQAAMATAQAASAENASNASGIASIIHGASAAISFAAFA